MKLWSVIFTHPDCPISSARVACPTKEKVLEDITNDLPPQPEGSILCRHMGEYDTQVAGVIHLIKRNGEIYEASLA